MYGNESRFEECASIDAGLPKRMSRDEAVSYYNKKLHDYWSSIMFQELSRTKREKMINYLMFNKPNSKHQDA